MSLMQLCWDLIWSPRSKGIPYVVENGTFNQGLKLMLAYRTKSVCENPYNTSKYLVL